MIVWKLTIWQLMEGTGVITGLQNGGEYSLIFIAENGQTIQRRYPEFLRRLVYESRNIYERAGISSSGYPG